MTRMPHGDSRNVFLVVAGGNPSAERHFEDTIQRKRTLQDVSGFLPFRVWGAVPGPSQLTRMRAGDRGTEALKFRFQIEGQHPGELYGQYRTLLRILGGDRREKAFTVSRTTLGRLFLNTRLGTDMRANLKWPFALSVDHSLHGQLR